jgi:hypothetical protein
LNRKKKSIKILKKLVGSVRFRFYKSKTEKIEPNPNKKTRAKPAKNWVKPKNRAKPVWTVFVLKNQTKTGQFESISDFFKKIRFNYFFIKTKPNKKIITTFLRFGMKKDRISGQEIPIFLFCLSSSKWNSNSNNYQRISRPRLRAATQ